MPADLASDDDPDCMAVALPHPYAPRRPKATAEAQDRHLFRYLLTSSPSHPLSPRPPDFQPGRDIVPGNCAVSTTRKPPEACAGILGRLGRKSETPKTMPEILKTSPSRCSSCLEVLGGIEVLEVPKAPSEAPERDHGFLGIVERLRQVLGVIESFCATPEPPEACAGVLE
ncbi:hypothetical protein K523DRAFT_358646 [Schizophyllum commune Tattone D]|nr:hypothetical protein K523DRAFT_358646 [Schizophyllum commune Tattone D]